MPAALKITMHQSRWRVAARGFTLIELMITMTIIAILSMLAFPSYEAQIRRGRRIDAKSALLDVAARQERYFSMNNRYTATAQDLGYAKFPMPIGPGGRSHYSLQVTLSNGEYSAIATPTGAQTKDNECYSFTIDSSGVRGNINASGASLASSKCW